MLLVNIVVNNGNICFFDVVKNIYELINIQRCRYMIQFKCMKKNEDLMINEFDFEL